MNAREEVLDLLRRTHQIWNGIRGSDIALLSTNPPGRTDCETFIAVPIEDPEARLILAHEWQHILFKSNLRARESFVNAYAVQLRERIRAPAQGLEDFLHFFINALDDVRVSSLWELIYPQSAEDIQNRWRRIIDTTKRYRKDLVLYTMALGLGMRFPPEENLEWDRYESLLLDTTQKVLRRGFPACLLAARVALDTILDDVLKQVAETTGFTPPPPVALQQLQPPGGQHLGGTKINRPDGPVVDEKTAKAQADTLDKMASALLHKTKEELQLKGSWTMMDTDRVPVSRDPDWEATNATVQAALGASSADQVNYVLEQSQSNIQQILKSLEGHHLQLSPDEKLLKGYETRVFFKDVRPSMVSDLPLRVQDLRLVQVMRQSFIKLMDKRSSVRTESGSDLDSSAYIDMLYGDGDPAIFKEEANSRGFSALILIDMSGSMRPRWETISRACKVLAKSMKFPFSSFEVWGFSSDHEGRTHILRFEDPERGYWGPDLKEIWGLTPLHIAAEVGVRRLQLLPGSTQHLFILTDGYPTHLGIQSGFMPTTSELMVDVMKRVREGRSRGVNVSGLVIGCAVLDESADFMFSGRWSRLDDSDEDLFHGVVGLVKHSFSHFLGHR
jgi:hypothetical protein